MAISPFGSLKHIWRTWRISALSFPYIFKEFTKVSMGEGVLVLIGEVEEEGSVLVEQMVWGRGFLSFLHLEVLYPGSLQWKHLPL